MRSLWFSVNNSMQYSHENLFPILSCNLFAPPLRPMCSVKPDKKEWGNHFHASLLKQGTERAPCFPYIIATLTFLWLPHTASASADISQPKTEGTTFLPETGGTMLHGNRYQWLTSPIHRRAERSHRKVHFLTLFLPWWAPEGIRVVQMLLGR